MTKINIQQLKKMFTLGAEAISDEYEYINELNIFPVPDGDTGSNMKITTEGAVNTVKDTEFTDLFVFGKQFSRALLMNARGNSGVIFSQIIKGFVSVFKEGSKELGISDFIEALIKAKEIAYKSVANPVEGTILTVIRVTSEKIYAKRTTYKSFEEVLNDTVNEAEKILADTPNFLAELKSAGVVDSGGYGLTCFLKGMYKGLTASPDKKETKAEATKPAKPKPVVAFNKNFKDNNEGFGYCCEFILKVNAKVSLEQKDKDKLDEKALKTELLEFGESLAIVRDEDILKVHVHTITPYKVLLVGQKYGEFSKVKVENMTFQFLERNPGMTLEKAPNKKEVLSQKPAVIVTVPTGKLIPVFKDDLAVDYVINCEKNGNPSIQEFVTALNCVKSAKIFLFVDDGNMMLAAKEAVSLFNNSNKNTTVHLFNTTDVAATYNFCLSYNPEESFDSNFKLFTRKMKYLTVGKISKSIKMVKYSHIDVKKNDFIGIISKKIISSSKNIDLVIKQTIQALIKMNKKAKNFLIIYGKDAKPSSLSTLEKELIEKYGKKVNMIPSDDPIYLFHFSLE